MALLLPGDYDDFCPYCFTSFDYNSENEKIKQIDIDSGNMLDPEAESANEAALIETEDINKIPIPDQDKIPIATKQTSEPTWQRMLKKAFMSNKQ